jgi:hypothetical protein
MSKYVYTEVEVDLSDFSDEELTEELESRGRTGRPCIQSLYDAWVYKTGNFEDLFRQFCQQSIGRSF